jgi:hypothetical protein
VWAKGFAWVAFNARIGTSIPSAWAGELGEPGELGELGELGEIGEIGEIGELDEIAELAELGGSVSRPPAYANNHLDKNATAMYPTNETILVHRGNCAPIGTPVYPIQSNPNTRLAKPGVTHCNI